MYNIHIPVHCQKFMNIIHIFICQRFTFQILFVFLFFQKNIYSLHSGFDSGRVTTRVLGSTFYIFQNTPSLSSFTNKK